MRDADGRSELAVLDGAPAAVDMLFAVGRAEDSAAGDFADEGPGTQGGRKGELETAALLVPDDPEPDLDGVPVRVENRPADDAAPAIDLDALDDRPDRAVLDDLRRAKGPELALRHRANS